MKWILILSILIPGPDGGRLATFESVWLSLDDCRTAENDARRYVPVFESRCETDGR